MSYEGMIGFIEETIAPCRLSGERKAALGNLYDRYPESLVSACLAAAAAEYRERRMLGEDADGFIDRFCEMMYSNYILPEEQVIGQILEALEGEYPEADRDAAGKALKGYVNTLRKQGMTDAAIAAVLKYRTGKEGIRIDTADGTGVSILVNPGAAVQ